MKITTGKIANHSRFHLRNGVHLVCLMTMVCLIIAVPVTNSLTGTPSYWAIAILFGIPLLLYLIFLLHCCKKKHTKEQQPVDQEGDTIRLQIDQLPSSIVSSSYNLSTVGIPPSSYLAPLPATHASNGSSSLDYAPPPPAYHDSMALYPPSYHTVKDDNVSVSY